MVLKPEGRSGIIQYNQAKQRFIEQLSQVPFLQMRKLKATVISISLSYTLK